MRSRRGGRGRARSRRRTWRPARARARRRPARASPRLPTRLPATSRSSALPVASAASDSGAPLLKAWRPSPSSYTIVIRFRSGENGSSCTRSRAPSSSSCEMPRSIAASRRALSTGSPTKWSSAQRASDASTAASSSSDSPTPSAGRRAATRIWFSVSVPVLSVQMTVVSPSVSIAASRRTIAPRRAIARAPSASAAVTVAASPSGTAATATATPVRNASSQVPPRTRIRPARTTVIAIPATTIWRARRPRRSVSGVGGAFAVAARISISPSCVRGPVSQTSARARPRVTPVPAKIIDARSASGVSASTGSTCLATGSDSPVRADSSTSRELASTSRASAATRSPSPTSRTSPGTTSCAGSSRARPVADDERGLGERLRERQDRTVGAQLLPESEHRVQHEDRRDRDPLARIADRHRDHGGDDQQRHQRIEQLVASRAGDMAVAGDAPARSARTAPADVPPRPPSVRARVSVPSSACDLGARSGIRSLCHGWSSERRAPSTSPDGRPARRRCRAPRARGGRDCRPRRGR